MTNPEEFSTEETDGPKGRHVEDQGGDTGTAWGAETTLKSKPSEQDNDEKDDDK